MIIVNIGAGLGNQMFQYAFGKAYSIKNGEKLYIPIKSYNNENGLREFGLNRFQLIDDVNQLEKSKKIHFIYLARIFLAKSCRKLKLFSNRECVFNVYYEKSVRQIKKIPYKPNVMNIYSGIFQNPKLFDDIRLTLLEDFGFKNVKENIIDYGNKLSSEKSVALHIRRGDYLIHKQFAVCSKKYYEEAISVIREKVPGCIIYAFSDDIEWVKSNFHDVTPIDFTKDMYEDLYLMTKCNNFIISNSTFSFWGQYLSQNKNKTVIAPNKWFTYEEPGEDCIYQDNWILIDVENHGEKNE